MATLGSRLAHAWNAFNNKPDDTPYYPTASSVVTYGGAPSRVRMTFQNERSIISSIYTRIGIDCAQIDIAHVRLDAKGRYTSTIGSGLQECLSLRSNLDQTGRAFRQDVVMTLLDKGVVAIVPVDTTLNPLVTGGWDVNSLRAGEVVGWYPQHVRVRVYNEKLGQREEVTLEKRFVAIVENPLYSVMNERNSTLQRLIRKMNLLDTSDENAMSGKLDLIIQLPYVVKSEARKQQADQRRKDIEFQLRGSEYGIAYTDGTEKITQLNRPVENNLPKQVEYLTEQLYAQLGLTPEVMSGTANEKVMLNYYNRTVEPILTSIVEAMNVAFLTKTARTQGQAIRYIRAPFKLVPVENLAEIADKFTRNEIMSANEIRSVIGLEPSDDPKADELRNSNMPDQNPQVTVDPQPQLGGKSQNEA